MKVNSTIQIQILLKLDWKQRKYLKENSMKNKIDFAVIHFGDVYGADGWFYEMLVKRLKKKYIQNAQRRGLLQGVCSCGRCSRIV